MGMTTIWMATATLRLRESTHYLDEHIQARYTLEQAWISSEGETDWRPIPVVTEGGNFIEASLDGCRD